MLWSEPWLPGMSIRWSRASTGPRAAPEDSTGGLLATEEVTEKWVGASEGPGNSRKGQMLLTLRVRQRAGLQSRGLPWQPCEACSPFQQILRKTSALELRLLPVTPGSLCTEGQGAAAFRAAHVSQFLRPMSWSFQRRMAPTLEYCWPGRRRGW